MRKATVLVTALTVALGLGAATAQTNNTSTTQAQTATFTDVPAGHWAREAVQAITEQGLIQGFPDGTFRGNENLTRYQAALIFYRLLQSGALSNMSAQDQTTVARGMTEVAAELATITARVTDLEQANQQMAQRLQALEQQVSAAGTAGANTAAFEQRIAALEQTVRQLQQQAAQPAPAGNTAALEQRIAALEQRINQQAQATQPAPAPAPAPTTTTPPANNSVAVVPGQGTTVVVSGAAPIITTPSTFVGISGQYMFGAPFSFSTLGYKGMIGTSNLIGRFGGRLDFGYMPTTGALDTALSLTMPLGTGGFLDPYLGLGAGLVYSSGHTGTPAAGTSVIDYNVTGLVGADFRFTDTLALFGEVNPRYFFSNQGVGTGLATGAAGGFGISAKAGLKFYF